MPATLLQSRVSQMHWSAQRIHFAEQIEPRINADELLNVFPVPGFVEVGTKTEAFGVAHKPAIRRRVDLNRAVRVARVDGAAANVEIERAAGEVWTVDCKSGAACVR